MGESKQNASKNSGDEPDKQPKQVKKSEQKSSKPAKGQGDPKPSEGNAGSRQNKGSNAGHNHHTAKHDAKVRKDLDLVKDTTAFKIPLINANAAEQIVITHDSGLPRRDPPVLERQGGSSGGRAGAAAGSASQVATDGPLPGSANKRKTHDLSDEEDDRDGSHHESCNCKRQKLLHIETQSHSFDAIPSYLRDPGRRRSLAGRRRRWGPPRPTWYEDDYYDYYDYQDGDYDSYGYDYDDEEYFEAGEDPGCEGLMDESDCFPDERPETDRSSSQSESRVSHTHEANDPEPPVLDCEATMIASDDNAGQPDTMEGDLLSAHLAPVDDETGPPINSNLARVCNDLWDRALTQPDSLRIKETFDVLPRPKNTETLIKTEINPEIKSRLPKAAAIKDMQSKSAQTAILKAANALLGLLQQVVSQHAPPRQELVDAGVQSLRCLAYGASRVNAHRRQLLRPHLNRAYQSLCDRPSDPSHALLLGDNLAQQARETSETSRLASRLNSGFRRPRFRRSFRGRYNRGHFLGTNFHARHSYSSYLQCRSRHSWVNFPDEFRNEFHGNLHSDPHVSHDPCENNIVVDTSAPTLPIESCVNIAEDMSDMPHLVEDDELDEEFYEDDPPSHDDMCDVCRCRATQGGRGGHAGQPRGKNQNHKKGN